MPLFDIFKKKPPFAKKASEGKKEKEKPSFVPLSGTSEGKGKPKKIKKVIEKKPSEVRVEKKPKKEKPTKETEIKAQVLKPKAKISSQNWQILKGPHITEKGTDLNKKNQYVFKVYSEVNKKEIKKAISNLYNVDVLSVRTINVPRRSRRLGKSSGWRKGYKKAIIKIKKGQKIELLPR